MLHLITSYGQSVGEEILSHASTFPFIPELTLVATVAVHKHPKLVAHAKTFDKGLIAFKTAMVIYTLISAAVK